MPKLWVGFLKCVSQTRPHSFQVLLQVLLYFLKWRISPCFSLLFCSFSNCSFSFYICLQLPPPQLESALNKHANLRGPLATYANQPSTKTSLPRYNSKGPNLSPSLIRESSRLLFHSAVIFFSLPFVMLLFY